MATGARDFNRLLVMQKVRRCHNHGIDFTQHLAIIANRFGVALAGQSVRAFQNGIGDENNFAALRLMKIVRVPLRHHSGADNSNFNHNESFDIYYIEYSMSGG